MFTLVLALAAGACGERRGSPAEPDEPDFDWDTTAAEPAEEGRPPCESRRRGEDKRRAKSGRRTRVTGVIDGDAVDTAKLGRVRLIGADTPEAGECHDDAATRFTRDRIGGKVVRYELGEERTDRYGRTLAYLWRGGRMHNLDLVREGNAKVLTIPPNDRYADRFEAAERTARRGDEGRWGACENGTGIEERPRRRPRGGTGSLPPPPPDLDCSDLSGPVTMVEAPTPAKRSRKTSSLALTSPPSEPRPCISLNTLSGGAHSCSISPPIPSGLSSLWSRPATYPSSEIAMLNLSLLTVSSSVSFPF